jgi:excisionase family DNA binding protein
MNKEWSTVEEAAPALGLSKQGMYDAIRKGQLPSESVLRIGKRILINLRALNAQANHEQKKQGEYASTDG